VWPNIITLNGVQFHNYNCSTIDLKKKIF
jgi:hypothetical protein